MSEDLRRQVVEAMAIALAMSGVHTERRVGALTEATEAALDAALDVLADNAEAWGEAAGSRFMTSQQFRAATDGEAKVLGLIDSLRSPTSSKGE